MAKLLVFALCAFCALIADVRCQQQQTDCSTDWKNQRQCMKDKRNQYSTNKEMDEENRQNARYKIAQCYKRAGCNTPFASDAVDAQMKTCSDALRKSIRRDLRSCLSNKGYRDYDLPKDNPQAIAWGQDAWSVKHNPCNRGKNDQNYKNCMIDAYNTTFNNNKGSGSGSSRKTDACSVRQQCNQQYKVRSECYDREQTIKGVLCTCTDSMNTQKYKSDYVSCMRSVQNVNEDNDFNLAAINRIKDKYCNQKKDPCNGFNGKSSNYKGRGSGKNWGRGGSSSQSNANSNNGYDFSQVGDTDSGVMPSTGYVMGTGDSAGDYDLNNAAAASNSGMSPDLFSAFSGSQSASQSSSSGGGGGLFSSFLGGGGGGSPLDAFTGGAGGGSNSILGLLSGAGGGGGLDPSSLIGGLGGIGGKKKK